MPLACFEISGQNQIKAINPFVNEFLKPSNKDELIGKSIFDVLPAEEHQNFLNFINRITPSNSNQQWENFHLISSDGSTNKFLWNGTINTHQDGQDSDYLLIAVPCANNNLSENNFEFLINNAPIGMALLDIDGSIKATNTTFHEHIGKDEGPMVGKHFSEILKKQASDRLFTLSDILQKNQQTYVKDVLTFDISKDDHRIFELTYFVVNDAKGHPTNAILFTEDITNQADTHIALIQSEKLSLTGRLAASLAHEINNPLQTSLGCLGLVEEMLDENDKELRVYINLAIDELQRSARIVKKLRDLNRSTDASERCPVDLREIIEGVLMLTKHQLTDKNIVPVFTYHGPPPVISVSRDQIQQVILNLVMNAIDELPHGGNIYFNITLTENPKGVTISIRDTGKGIDPEIAESIFDPFFSTKEEGIGLGLFICKQIIQNHSGTLQFKSEPGQGTEFSIWIPDHEIIERKDQVDG
jgi:PAS domain S-box-containing protein